ncbi:quinoprotein relay system zinc metallohydrolase 2 [Maritimibacter sp. 55A14]|uniref:quinoprotein relay system zinc metallohydrolase 2 n=1 Tax=Maritimibacter sp. 55A14 TaxID=2174844 RepID=UPI000D617AF3|nr:quinoprotein relay system zinc metallohydrolase 2 [Maritimibacter sp. 55A14]PWE31212.1 quinoprotein relay system zinc metallohydrolase 2 [Maritimibacter sp. 55A14]
MFEILLSLCLAGAPESCTERLVPVAAPDCPAAFARLPDVAPDWGADHVARDPRCVERPGSDLEFTEIAPGVHVHRGQVADVGPDNLGDVANIGFVIGRDSVAVIDAGGSRAVGEQVYLALRSVTDKPISHMILTHMHPDHVYGAPVLAEAGAEIWGHAKLPQALAARAQSYGESYGRLIGPGFAGSGLPVPARTVEDSARIDLGGRELLLVARPTAHSESDLTVYDVATRTLFTGDLVFDEHSPALDGSLRGWLDVLAALGDPMPARLVPGHGGPVLDWPAGIAALRGYLVMLRDETRAAIEAGLRLGEAVDRVGWSAAPGWALFDLYHPRNVTAAFTELEWE